MRTACSHGVSKNDCHRDVIATADTRDMIQFLSETLSDGFNPLLAQDTQHVATDLFKTVR